MTIPAEVDVVVTPETEAGSSYVDWPAIIAGIVLASAISILLLAFGSAVGLSFTNFHAREGVSPIWLAIAGASWLLWVQISSFMAGGYITGRLRKRHGDATEEESDLRDGAHGLLVWAGALIVGAALAVGGIGAAANAVGSAAATVTTAASNVAGGAAGALDPNAYFIDTLYRPSATPAPATSTQGFGAAAPAPIAADAEAVRAETGRIFAQAATGEVSAEDRAYLAQLVARQTGLSAEEAEARVAQVVSAIDTAKAEAVEVAETARKTGVLGAFLIAASLLVSAVGAFWAAQVGGNHRDRNMAFPDVFRRF